MATVEETVIDIGYAILTQKKKYLNGFHEQGYIC